MIEVCICELKKVRRNRNESKYVSIVYFAVTIRYKILEVIIMGMPIITPSETTRPQAVTDIIESVALEQTALSHILNAEGEKLQKIIATSSDPAVLIAANSSVEKMIKVVSYLEMILRTKLELFDVNA